MRLYNHGIYVVLVAAMGLSIVGCGSSSHPNAKGGIRQVADDSDLPTDPTNEQAPWPCQSGELNTPHPSPSDDPADYPSDAEVGVTGRPITQYSAVISKTIRWMVDPLAPNPASRAPAGVDIGTSNNNLDLFFYDNQLFFAWRSAEGHGAGSAGEPFTPRIYVVSSRDCGETWSLEHTANVVDKDGVHRDLREPRFYVDTNNTLQLHYFGAGTSAFAFEPENSWRIKRSAGGSWSKAERVGLPAGCVVRQDDDTWKDVTPLSETQCPECVAFDSAGAQHNVPTKGIISACPITQKIVDTGTTETVVATVSTVDRRPGEVIWNIKRRGEHVVSTGYYGFDYSFPMKQLRQIVRKTTVSEETSLFSTKPVYEHIGGVAEAAVEFDAEGGLWMVTRNEVGEQSHQSDHIRFGSQICYFPATIVPTMGTLLQSELDAYCVYDGRRFDSPQLFRHEKDIYLLARWDGCVKNSQLSVDDAACLVANLDPPPTGQRSKDFSYPAKDVTWIDTINGLTWLAYTNELSSLAGIESNPWWKSINHLNTVLGSIPYVPEDSAIKGAYWGLHVGRPKGFALYKVSKHGDSLNVTHQKFLHGFGDTAFPAIRRTGRHTYLIANYSTRTETQNDIHLSWQQGKSKTGIYFTELRFEPLDDVAFLPLTGNGSLELKPTTR